jgi:hypothetical protein
MNGVMLWNGLYRVQYTNPQGHLVVVGHWLEQQEARTGGVGKA